MSRRALLAAGGGVTLAGAAGALVEYDVLPGRTRVHDVLGRNGDDGRIPDIEPGPVRFGTLETDRVADPPEWAVAYPPGTPPGAGLPTVVVLHHAGSSARAVFATLGLPQFLAASGARMALVAVDGGAHSYWHPRADGSDPGGMVLEDLLPTLGGLGLQVDRPGFLGWSMGGLGVLAVAARFGAAGGTPGPVVAVSPALWPSYEQAAAGAFDDEADWEDVMGGVEASLDGEREVRVDCGTGDPFYRDVRETVSGYPVETHFDAGDHTPGYWTRVLPGELAWLAQRLPAAAE